MKYLGAMLVLLTMSLGCSSAKDEAVLIDDVPKQLLEIAKSKLPEVTFDQAVRKGNGVLEVRGKDKSGKVRDIEFNAKGEVVEIE